MTRLVQSMSLSSFMCTSVGPTNLRKYFGPGLPPLLLEILAMFIPALLKSGPILVDGDAAIPAHSSVMQSSRKLNRIAPFSRDVSVGLGLMSLALSSY